jgi:hypothetical protein
MDPRSKVCLGPVIVFTDMDKILKTLRFHIFEGILKCFLVLFHGI